MLGLVFGRELHEERGVIPCLRGDLDDIGIFLGDVDFRGATKPEAHRGGPSRWLPGEVARHTETHHLRNPSLEAQRAPMTPRARIDPNGTICGQSRFRHPRGIPLWARLEAPITRSHHRVGRLVKGSMEHQGRSQSRRSLTERATGQQSHRNHQTKGAHGQTMPTDREPGNPLRCADELAHARVASGRVCCFLRLWICSTARMGFRTFGPR